MLHSLAGVRVRVGELIRLMADGAQGGQAYNANRAISKTPMLDRKNIFKVLLIVVALAAIVMLIQAS